MPQTMHISAFPTFQFQRSTDTPGLDPVLKRWARYPVRRRRAAGSGRGRGPDLFLAPFKFLPILFNHGFKPRDVLNARFQL
jgi:hypothetical protein